MSSIYYALVVLCLLVVLAEESQRLLDQGRAWTEWTELDQHLTPVALL